MEGLTEWLLGFVQQEDSALGLLALAGAAALEYIVPPFPGDTVTLLGAVLITAYGWNFPLVFGAVMLGSVGGAMAAFALGLRWRHRRETRPRSGKAHQTIDRLVARFERHGAAYLVINRFLPGIRTLFFVAAGLAEMRIGPVVFYSALSAALWNLGLIGIGAALGTSFEELLGWVQRYTVLMWILIGAVLLLWILRALWTRRRERRTSA